MTTNKDGAVSTASAISASKEESDLVSQQYGSVSTTPTADCDEEKCASKDVSPDTQRSITGLKWILVVMSTLSSAFTYALDNTVVANIVPAIVDDFGDVSDLPWLSVGFSLGGVAMVMLFGKLYGLFDAKTLYITSSIVFMAASALCGAAPNMNAEIVGRVFAGAGGNGMYVGVMTLLSGNTSAQERPIYLGLIGLVWGVGTVLGPVVGGAFELVTWRWAFYINLIIGGVFLPICYFLLPNFRPADGRRTTRLRSVDWIGAVLSIGGFTTLILAVSFGGIQYQWSSGTIITLFVVGGMVWMVFVLQQAFAFKTTVKERIFPIHMLLDKEAVLLFIAMAAGGASGFIGIYYIPIYFQYTRGDTGIEAAVRLLPYICLLSAMVLFNGGMMSKLGYYKPWYVGGSALLLVGSVLLSTIGVSTSTAKIYGYEVLAAIGAGAFVQSGYAVLQALVEPSEMASAITFMMVAQLSGVVFGLSISGAIFINSAKSNLQAFLPDANFSQIEALISGTSSQLLETLSETQTEGVLSIVVAALRKAFIPMYVGAAISFVAALSMRNERLFGAK